MFQLAGCLHQCEEDRLWCGHSSRVNPLTEQPLLGGVHLGRQPRRLREEDTGAAGAVLAAVPASDVILPRPHRVLMTETVEGEKSVKCVAIHISKENVLSSANFSRRNIFTLGLLVDSWYILIFILL